MDSFQCHGGLTTTCERPRFTTVDSDRPHRTRNHSTITPKSTTFREPPCRVRTRFSSHHSPPEVSMAEHRDMFASLLPPTPSSTYSVTTKLIKGRRGLLRKILDVGSCTKGDTFDIHDLMPVHRPIMYVLITRLPGSLEDISPRPLRYERWREHTFQMLYTGAGTAVSTPNFSPSVRCISNAI